MLSRSFSPSKLPKHPPPPPPLSERKRNHDRHGRRHRQSHNHTEPPLQKDDPEDSIGVVPTLTPSQSSTSRGCESTLEQPYPQPTEASSSPLPPTTTTTTTTTTGSGLDTIELLSTDHHSDSSLSGVPSWNHRLRLLQIFHRKQQQPYISHHHRHNINLEGNHEMMTTTTGSTKRSDTEHKTVSNTTITATMDGSDSYGEPLQLNVLKQTKKSRKRKAPYRIHHIQNTELKLPLHYNDVDVVVGDDPIIPKHSSPLPQPPQRNTILSHHDIVNGSNRRTSITHPSSVHTTTTTNHTDTDDITPIDPVSDFDDTEWTPMDSSYGAAIPLAGWIPKGIRRTIEFTVLVGLALIIVVLVVETSLRSSNHKNNTSSNNNNNNNNAAVVTTTTTEDGGGVAWYTNYTNDDTINTTSHNNNNNNNDESDNDGTYRERER